MPEWGYDAECGPQNWHKSFPHAGGNRQSPIDINTDEVKYDPNLAESPLVLNYDPRRTKSLINNGHTFQVNIDACDYSKNMIRYGWFTRWLTPLTGWLTDCCQSWKTKKRTSGNLAKAWPVPGDRAREMRNRRCMSRLTLAVASKDEMLNSSV